MKLAKLVKNILKVSSLYLFSFFPSHSSMTSLSMESLEDALNMIRPKKTIGSCHQDVHSIFAKPEKMVISQPSKEEVNSDPFICLEELNDGHPIIPLKLSKNDSFAAGQAYNPRTGRNEGFIWYFNQQHLMFLNNIHGHNNLKFKIDDSVIVKEFFSAIKNFRSSKFTSISADCTVLAGEFIVEDSITKGILAPRLMSLAFTYNLKNQEIFILPGLCNDFQTYVTGLSKDGTFIIGNALNKNLGLQAVLWTKKGMKIMELNSCVHNLAPPRIKSEEECQRLLENILQDKKAGIEPTNTAQSIVRESLTNYISNDAGLIIGQKNTSSSERVSIRWVKSGNVYVEHKLKYKSISEYIFMEYITDNNKIIVGQAIDEDMEFPRPRAVLWQIFEDKIMGCQFLKSSYFILDKCSCIATVANQDGSIIAGSAQISHDDRVAFIWTRNTGMKFLTDFMNDNDVFGYDNTILTDITDMSANGEMIIGRGQHTLTQQTFSFRLVLPMSKYLN